MPTYMYYFLAIILAGLVLGYKSKSSKKSVSDSIYDTTLKSDLGTYYLYAFAVYILLLVFVINQQYSNDTIGSIFILLMAFGIVLGALIHFTSNWIYKDAKERRLGGSKWAHFTFYIPFSIPYYLMLRKKYPRIKIIQGEDVYISKSRIITATTVWLLVAIPITYALLYWVNINS